jgi:hypothetical protein
MALPDEPLIVNETTVSEQIRQTYKNIEKAERELDEAFEVAVTTGYMLEAMEGFKPTRNNFAASAALDVAVEHLLESIHADPRLKRFVAKEDFVGYPTSDKVLAVSEENFASLREATFHIAQRIGKVLLGISVGFTQIFNHQNLLSMSMKRTADQIDQGIELVKHENMQLRTEPFHDDRVVRLLSQDGHAPTPVDVLRGLESHMRQMNAIYEYQEHVTQVLFRCLSDAVHVMSRPREEMSPEKLFTALRPVFAVLYQKPVGHDHGVVHEDNKNYEAYEEKLVFGGKSFWSMFEIKEPSERQWADHMRFIVFKVSDSSHAPGVPHEAMLEPLNQQQIERLNRLCQEQITRLDRVNKHHASIKDRFATHYKIASDWLDITQKELSSIHSEIVWLSFHRAVVEMWFVARLAQSVFNRAHYYATEYDTSVVRATQEYIYKSMRARTGTHAQ